MKTEEIKELIGRIERNTTAASQALENVQGLDHKLAILANFGDLALSHSSLAASALRFLLQEREGKPVGDGGAQDWTKGTEWVHLKTGRIYTTVGRCRFEASGEPAVLYRGSEGTIWARAMDEFLDGRFDRVAPPQSQGDRPEVKNA